MTYRSTFSAAVLFTAFLMVCPQPASAQEARSFEQLQLLVKPGDRIFLTDSTGKVTEGRVADLSKTSLSVKTKSAITNWAEADVMQIRKWRQDSLKNGAAIGTGVGLGIGALGALAWCREYGDDCGAEVAAGVAVYAGIGAAIGIGIDALIPAKQTIFTGVPRTALKGLRVKPLVSNARKGVAVAFSF